MPFDNITLDEAVAMVERMLASGRPHYLVTPNMDFLVQAREDVELRRILLDAHLVLCDGMPLVWASRLLGTPLPERVAGADLVPLLIGLAARKNHRVFLLGGTVESTARAVDRLRREHPGLAVDGYSPPFKELLAMDHEGIKRRIREFRAEILLVSFGCPKQEKWLAMQYESLGVPVCAGVGGTIDFLAGEMTRAPVWMRRTGAEWLYRLAQEPRRLAGRYAKDLLVFGWAITGQWWLLRRGTPNGQTAALPPNIETGIDGIAPAPLPFPRGKAGAGATANWRDIEETDRWLRVNLGERLDWEIVRDGELSLERLIRDDRPFLLGLEAVRQIDSAGVAWLMRLERAFRKAGGHMVLVSPSRAVVRALKLLRVEPFFSSRPDAASACALVEARKREKRSMVGANMANPALVSWQGEITAVNAEHVWRLTEARIAAGPDLGQLVIDLSGVRFIDSSGLSLMERAWNLARRNGLQLDFMGAQPAVRNALRFARLSSLVLDKGA